MVLELLRLLWSGGVELSGRIGLRQPLEAGEGGGGLSAGWRACISRWGGVGGAQGVHGGGRSKLCMFSRQGSHGAAG